MHSLNNSTSFYKVVEQNTTDKKEQLYNITPVEINWKLKVLYLR